VSPSSPSAFALVALGGAAGAMLRHALNVALAGAAWPKATFVANVAGCLLFGLVAGLAMGRMPETVRLLVVTGFLGGLTTFSAFGGETASLLRQRPAAAAAYAAASVAAGLAGVIGGERLGLLLRGPR
jgi:fluoride exporter